jgi:hypothetical protein
VEVLKSACGVIWAAKPDERHLPRPAVSMWACYKQLASDRKHETHGTNGAPVLAEWRETIRSELCVGGESVRRFEAAEGNPPRLQHLHVRDLALRGESVA